MLKQISKNTENKRFSKKHSIKPEKKEEKKRCKQKEKKNHTSRQIWNWYKQETPKDKIISKNTNKKYPTRCMPARQRWQRIQ